MIQEYNVIPILFVLLSTVSMVLNVFLFSEIQRLKKLDEIGKAHHEAVMKEYYRLKGEESRRKLRNED